MVFRLLAVQFGIKQNLLSGRHGVTLLLIALSPPPLRFLFQMYGTKLIGTVVRPGYFWRLLAPLSGTVVYDQAVSSAKLSVALGSCTCIKFSNHVGYFTMLAHHNADLWCRPVLVCALMSCDVCVYGFGLFASAAVVVFSCFA
jgi:hypothetical protein